MCVCVCYCLRVFQMFLNESDGRSALINTLNLDNMKSLLHFSYFGV